MIGCCCLCGLLLKVIGSTWPTWYKKIRALCWYDNQPVLAESGYYDDEEAFPFTLLIPVHGQKRFGDRRTSDDDDDSCYPFHAACWAILQEIHQEYLPDIETLWAIFSSSRYDREACNLRLDYYLEDLATLCSTDGEHRKIGRDLMSFKSLNLTLTDSLVIKPRNFLPPSLDIRHKRQIISHSSSFLSLSPEIFLMILDKLSFDDVLNLLVTCRRFYSGNPPDLPLTFWNSRFQPHGEAGFARSICPPGCSPKDWFLTIDKELKEDGPNNMNLRNRRRVWKVGLGLLDLSRSIKDSQRVLYGDTEGSLQQPYSVASCIALKYDTEGCRELIQRFAPLSGKSNLCAVIPSYILIWDRRFISGLTFEFSDGHSTSIGYVIDRPKDRVTPGASPQFLWLISSPSGFEAVALDQCPSISAYGSRAAVSKWALNSDRSISVGLDAMRVVKVCIDTRNENSLHEVLWTSPYPSSMPTMVEDDISALYELQSESFAPASTHQIDSGKGQLIAIKVYCPGPLAGISGIRFVYDTGMETLWGSDFDTASLVFFLGRAEYLVKTTVYKMGSLVCHLQFVTNLHRTSDVFPPITPDTVLDCVDYRSLNEGYICGFCGCFMNSTNQLHCFGVTSTTAIATSKFVWSTPATFTLDLPSAAILPEMPLGRIGKHGEFQSQLILEKTYHSIKASINPARTKYRGAGQVTGLLFYSSDASHPDLLGQFTGDGRTYELENDERILDLEVTTTKPSWWGMKRHGLSQVEGLTVITNRRKITWSSGTTQIGETDVNHKRQVLAVSWSFNAIFDRVRCTYQTG